MRLTIPAAAILLLCTQAAQAAPVVLATKSVQPARGTGLRLSMDNDSFDAVIGEKKGTAVEFPMPDGTFRNVTLVKAPVPVVAPGAIYTIVGADGQQEERPIPPADVLYGQVEGDADSMLSIVRFNGIYAGSLELDGIRYDLIPGEGFDGKSNEMEAITPTAPSAPADCGFSESLRPDVAPMMMEYPVYSPPTSFEESRGATDTITIEIGIDSTYEYYTSTGSQDAALNYMVALMAIVDAVYQRDVQAAYSVTGFRTFTANNDPYSSSNNSETYLNTLRSRVSANTLPASIQNADLVHLLHNNGGTNLGGIAYLSAVCETAGFKTGFSDLDLDKDNYAIDGYANDVLVVAHELGHNTGSEHSHCYEPPLDQCWNQEAGCYSGPVVESRGSTMSYCHLFYYGSGDIVFHARTKTVIRNFLEAHLGTCLSIGGGPSNDPAVVFSSLDTTNWEFISIPAFFTPPTSGTSGGLSMTAAPNAIGRVGFWQTKSALNALPAGLYRITASVQATLPSQSTRQPEFRLRVFSADNSYTEMGISAQAGTSFVRNQVYTYYESDGVTPFYVAFDLVAGTPEGSGTLTMTSLTYQQQ